MTPSPLGVPVVISALLGGGWWEEGQCWGRGAQLLKTFSFPSCTVSPDGELYILGEWSSQSGSQLGQGVQDLQRERNV